LLKAAALQAQYERLASSAFATRARLRQYQEWLQLDDLATSLPYIVGDELLAQDMQRQASLFLSDLLAQPQVPLVQLLSSSRQPLNARLAEHYGVAAEIGPSFVFVELDPNLHAGVLGQGALMTRFPSPSARGWYIQARMLGLEVPYPPDIHIFDLAEYEGETRRERLRNATDQAACAGCHQLLDPLGLALEAFDELGRLTGVDSSGELRSGTESQPVSNPGELGRAIASSRAGQLGAARAQLAHLLDRPASPNDDPWAACLIGAFSEGQVELHELARQVALSEAGRTMLRSPASVVAVSEAEDPIEHAIEEVATLLGGYTDSFDRAQLEEYSSALRELQQISAL
jgi:hypothetical protein